MGPLCARTSAASHRCQAMLWTAYPTIWKFGIHEYLDPLGAARQFLGWFASKVKIYSKDSCIVRVQQVSIDAAPTSPMCRLLGFTRYPILTRCHNSFESLHGFENVAAFWACFWYRCNFRQYNLLQSWFFRSIARSSCCFHQSSSLNWILFIYLFITLSWLKGFSANEWQTIFLSMFVTGSRWGLHKTVLGSRSFNRQCHRRTANNQLSVLHWQGTSHLFDTGVNICRDLLSTAYEFQQLPNRRAG